MAIKISLNEQLECPLYYERSINHVFVEWSSQKGIASKRVFVLIDSEVDRLHHGSFKQLFSSHLEIKGWIVIPHGEASKNSTQFLLLVDQLLHAGIRRNDFVFAVGGGVIGDLAGFVAASVLRGVPLVHFPTTLLSMVDSAIGGKTGINHDSGKNKIGAFYQPKAIFCSLEVLSTLPFKEWLCGIGEIVKYGCISNATLLSKLPQLIADRSQQVISDDWVPVIKDSAEIKVQIVEEDQFEMGKRAFLNFGHTIAHAIENQLGYGIISHGEAVFWGCWVELKLSELQGHTVSTDILQPFVQYYRDSFPYTSLDIDGMMEIMKGDKKNKSDVLTFVLLEALESPYLSNEVTKAQIRQAWSELSRYFI